MKKITRNRKRAYIILLIAAIIYGGYYLKTSKTDIKTSKTGAANYCKSSPKFIRKYQIQPPWAIDLTQRKFTGFRIIEYRKNGKVLQLPSWSSAGHLISYTVDKYGNIYLTPAPYVNLAKNPPHKQNKVYKVSSETGEMIEFIDLPGAHLLTSENPFGSFGLAYDCDTEGIYISSLAGSTYNEEKGVVFLVNTKSKEIIDKIEGIDVLGLAVFNSSEGKRLYYGTARNAEVHSVGLTKKGEFKNDNRVEFSMLNQQGGGLDKAIRIRFKSDNSMEVKAMEFSYSLMASSDPLRNIYIFDYNKKQWKFREMYKQK